MQNEGRGVLFAVALLSLPLLTIMASGGVAPGLNRIAEAFPESPEAVVQLVVSLPALVMIPVTFLCGVFLRFVSQRALILAGLLLLLLGGVGGGYVDSMAMLLACRVVVGLGAGIILPFSTGLIAICYEGGRKAQMMGFATAANSVGATFSTFAVGVFAQINWRYTFSVYWLAALSLVLVFLFMRNMPARREEEQDAHMPKSVFLHGVVALCVMMALFLIVTDLPFIVEEKGLGDSRLSGNLFAVNSVFIFLGGVALPWMLRLRCLFVPVGILVYVAGFLCIANGASLMPMYVGVSLAGVGFGALYSYVLDRLTGNVPMSLTVKAMAVGMAFAWFGQFLAPLITTGSLVVFGLDKVGLFQVVFGIGCVLAGVSLLTGLRRVGCAETGN